MRGLLIRTKLTEATHTNTGSAPRMSGSRPIGPLFPVPPKTVRVAIRSSAATTTLHQATQRGRIPFRNIAYARTPLTMAEGAYRNVNTICVPAHAARTVVGSVPEPLIKAAVASAPAPMVRTAAVTAPAPKNRAAAHSQPSPAVLMIERTPVNRTSNGIVAIPVRNASPIKSPLLVLIQDVNFLASAKSGGLPASRKSTTP